MLQVPLRLGVLRDELGDSDVDAVDVDRDIQLIRRPGVVQVAGQRGQIQGINFRHDRASPYRA